MKENIGVIRWRFENGKAGRAFLKKSHRICLWTRKI